jgi:hypothetical protein
VPAETHMHRVPLDPEIVGGAVDHVFGRLGRG